MQLCTLSHQDSYIAMAKSVARDPSTPGYELNSVLLFDRYHDSASRRFPPIIELRVEPLERRRPGRLPLTICLGEE